MRVNIPLIIAVGGCIYFGLTSIFILDRAVSVIDNLSGLNVIMGFVSYKKGCVDNTPKENIKTCNEKALNHKNELIEIHNKIDELK